MLRSNLVIYNCLVAYDLVARYIIPIDSVAGLEARLRRLLPTPQRCSILVGLHDKPPRISGRNGAEGLAESEYGRGREGLIRTIAGEAYRSYQDPGRYDC